HPHAGERHRAAERIDAEVDVFEWQRNQRRAQDIGNRHAWDFLSPLHEAAPAEESFTHAQRIRCPCCSRKTRANPRISLSPQPCATAAESAVSTPVDSGMA